MPLDFDQLLHEAELAHGHLCAGQILGVRMAMLGLARLGITDPRGADRKRLVTFIEIDRCAKQRARELYPEIENKNQQQMHAYREMSDADLFSEQWVQAPIEPREMPGYKSARIACAVCGEGINYDREVHRDGQILCLGCADPASRYYQPL